MRRFLRGLGPWILTGIVGMLLFALVRDYLEHERGPNKIEWRHPWALGLGAAMFLVGAVGFHLRRNRSAAMAFTRVRELERAGVGAVAAAAPFPVMLRVLAVGALAVGLARPETYETVTHDLDAIDIMLVLDLSKSMEATDLPLNRLDAAQRVVRNFVKHRAGDRIGLVIFANGAMLQCPLTSDMKALDQIVADLKIDDVPSQGTAIGDGLALGLSQLKRAQSKSRVVVLLSDGDNNVSRHYEPSQAGDLARTMGVKVFTVLVGSDTYGSDVNPETLRSIATETGGRFFRATDADELEKGFIEVRETLEKTKRSVQERKLDRELYPILLILAAVLLGLEFVLMQGRFRRFP
ncbi:MAG: VWA domain-containing protein [Deltaproteobacteria bacterium]|nr:VWA domain-containing protein [Deltaproteobacteria bacterium]